jgi:hypothetical protein
LKNWVAKGVASNVNDFKLYTYCKGIPIVRVPLWFGYTYDTATPMVWVSLIWVPLWDSGPATGGHGGMHLHPYNRQNASKVEFFLENIKVAFLSPSKNSKNLNFSTVHSRKFKFSESLLGDEKATYPSFRIISTLLFKKPLLTVPVKNT